MEEGGVEVHVLDGFVPLLLVVALLCVTKHPLRGALALERCLRGRAPAVIYYASGRRLNVQAGLRCVPSH